MATDPQSEQFEDLERTAREGRVSRRELLARASAVGLAAGALPTVLTAGASAAETLHAAAAAPKPGGTMQIGTPFGAASTNDPHPAPPGNQDVLRNFNVFNLLWTYDAKGKLINALGVEATPNAKATLWTIKIRSGVTFHDGSPLTADDVVYSLQRILDPKTKAEATGDIGMIDPKRISKVDTLTLKVGLKYPFSILPYQLATKGCSIVKSGTTDFTTPNGTGPFKFQSGDGQKVVLVKNPNYWNHGLPYLDSVQIVAVADATALLNGLRNGELDTIYPVDASQAAVVKNASNIQTVVNKTATYLPFSMDLAQKPFGDVRARQALKLAADRPALREVAYGGNGFLGNDMFGLLDPGYPKGVPQRKYDPEKAKSLWKSAGLADTTIQLWVSSIWPAQISSALAYAQQAKKAGIKIQVKTTPPDQYFTKAYGIKPFVNDYWNYRPILTNWQEEFNKNSGYYKIAHYATPKTTALWLKAAAETNESKRNMLTGDLMKLFRDTGPYVVWGFEAAPSLYSKRIGGARSDATRTLNGFHLEGFYINS